MKNTLIACAICVLFGIAGAMTANDEMDADAHYCEMVKSGQWGAYKEGVICD
jgi:hypothetical protein